MITVDYFSVMKKCFCWLQMLYIFVSFLIFTSTELLPNPQTKQDEIHNCQIVIDTLANKILHTSLSHITGKDIIEGDRTSVANLLEILTGLLEFLTEKIDCENSRDEEQEEGNVNFKERRMKNYYIQKNISWSIFFHLLAGLVEVP